jgi:hypothetical protein
MMEQQSTQLTMDMNNKNSSFHTTQTQRMSQAVLNRLATFGCKKKKKIK